MIETFGLVAIDLLIRSVVLLALVSLASLTVLRVVSAEARVIFWSTVIGALLLLPLLNVILPPIAIVLPVSETAVTGDASHAADISSLLLVVATLVYGSVTAMLVLRVFLGHVILGMAWRCANEDEILSRQIAQMAKRLGVRRTIALGIAHKTVVPMTWGTLAPKILLPACARDWPANRRNDVLLHEVAHVARADSLTRLLSALACALYWPNPLIWYAARRLRIEQEHVADSLVLRNGKSPHAYAQTLLEVAGGIGASHRAASFAAPMSASSNLESRLKAIMTPAAPKGRSATAKLALGGVALIVAAFSAMAEPTSAPENSRSLGARADDGSPSAAPADMKDMDDAAAYTPPRRRKNVSEVSPPSPVNPPTRVTPPTPVTAPPALAPIPPLPAIPAVAALPPVRSKPPDRPPSPD